ncbi:class I SAM-dependent DNA methyltransferase [Marinicrinis lubricantis]|uniref:Class I SAM-dependent DNA methyltransferase n=1 Tax=Marinicrinis lubricantis TaxID=2086470 RepID=A0ABW1IUV3_9BACL
MAYEQFAYVYDRLMEDMPYRKWLEYAQGVWNRLGHIQTVADLGCGTGNVAIPLGEAGYRVFGVDYSEDMLAVANEKWMSAASSSSKLHLQWLCQDMRELSLPEPVDSVISFCDSMNYLLEEDDLLQVFRRVHDSLRIGGCFLFDMHAPRQLQLYGECQPFVYNEDDVAYIWLCEYDEELHQVDHDLTFFIQREGSTCFERVEEFHTQRAYPYPVIISLLQQAGFHDIGCSSDFTTRPPHEATSRYFFAALK